MSDGELLMFPSAYPYHFNILSESEEGRYTIRKLKDYRRWKSDRDCRLLGILSTTGQEECYKRGFELCLVRGYRYSDDKDIFFSPDLSKQTTLTDMRRRGKVIVFNDESKYDREECWSLCGFKVKANHITRYEVRQVVAETSETPITRPDETKCPVCLDDLNGIKITCPNQHQTCNACFVLLSRKCCPVCRSNYHQDQIQLSSTHSGNRPRTLKESVIEYDYGKLNDYLFVYHLRRCVPSMYANPLHAFIISSLYRFVDLKTKPYLLPLTNTKSVYVKPSDDERLAYNEFFDYLYSTENIALMEQIPYQADERAYTEREFLTHLTAEYGAYRAMEILTDNSENLQTKLKLKRKMFMKHKARETKSFIFELINTSYEYMLLRPTLYPSELTNTTEENEV